MNLDRLQYEMMLTSYPADYILKRMPWLKNTNKVTTEVKPIKEELNVKQKEEDDQIEKYAKYWEESDYSQDGY
jgi:hypothetical protein